MYFLLIIFFISLAGVTFLIGRKVILLRRGGTVETGEFLFIIPSVEEIRVISIRNTKRLAYAILVNTIKLSLKSSNSLKNVSREIKEKTKIITAKYTKNSEKVIKEKKVSKFLKMISESKQKIRNIKSKIKKEEGIE